jgi:pyridoxamine 5'-phosphate oxidase
MLATLDEESVGSDPVVFFRKWFKEAEDARITEINAMTLATVDASGHPHARIVLLKGVDTGFVFFTNYDSAKGRDLAHNPNGAVSFFWKELERQVRVEGVVEKVSAGESDEYFHSRPRASRLGAWASPQSRKIEGRTVLDDAFARYEKEFSQVEMPRPPHWGGYRLVPVRVEFWQGRASRMHDRIVFNKEQGAWQRFRVAP